MLLRLLVGCALFTFVRAARGPRRPVDRRPANVRTTAVAVAPSPVCVAGTGHGAIGCGWYGGDGEGVAVVEVGWKEVSLSAGGGGAVVHDRPEKDSRVDRRRRL